MQRRASCCTNAKPCEATQINAEHCNALRSTSLQSQAKQLNCLINFFRFLGFLLWFVLGPGGLREAPGSPGRPTEGSGGPSGGPLLPRARVEKLKNQTCWGALLSGRVEVMQGKAKQCVASSVQSKAQRKAMQRKAIQCNVKPSDAKQSD